METIFSRLTGRVAGSILIVAGCCIGAGMLGAPVLSAVAGFFPSTLMFFLCWLFMMTTGLLLLEVNLWYQKEVSIATMVEDTLGKAGRRISIALFIYLFYSILIAYVSGCGSLFTGIADDLGFTVPKWVGATFFTALFAAVIYSGTAAVDWFNRFLVLGLAVSYFSLVAFGFSHVNADYLEFAYWPGMAVAIPLMIISFGYHNMIPSLTTYLDHARSKLTAVVLIGSLIPLLVYLIWGLIIMGIVPPGAFQGVIDEGEFATRALKNATDSSAISLLAEHFAFFAIVSSFITNALSFVDFYADCLHIKKDRFGKLILCTLTMLPPYLCAMIYPNLFLVALSFAGVFGALILFGVMPVMMVWNGRYTMNRSGEALLPGGKLLLGTVMAAALAAIVLSLAVQTNLIELSP